MIKELTLIAGSEETKKFLEKQILENMPMVKVYSFSIDGDKEIIINSKLVVLSSKLIEKELEEKNIYLNNYTVIISKRTIGYDCIDEIVSIPDKSKILLVSDSIESSKECIKDIKRLGIDNIELYPYYPGIKDSPKDITIAITPGEIDKVPRYIKSVYNIKPRIMDFSTITKIMYQLNLIDEIYEETSYKYLLKIVNMAKNLSEANQALRTTNFHLNTVIAGLNKGYLIYDENKIVKVFNEKLKNILNEKQKFIVENKIDNLIKNKVLLEFLQDNNQSKITSLKYMNKIINVEKIEIENSKLNLCIFECIHEEKFEKEGNLDKGFIAKYEFIDIIGESHSINKSKEIAKKLSKSNLTILIEGESGTGKELFASSIHKASNRKGGPFLAVNFSALPEDLLESQLFGYEEGAFTGAKKGGSKGLFEEADGGSIFLDEIGDISPKLQTRLLRVLQEKEIMRLGSNKIINVDVRIIAATNKNLEEMVKEKKFREDLYYRLKMGYVKLPPLRERKDDIEKLANYFISYETNDKLIFDEEIFNVLNKYNWPGNVRELRNTIIYMIAISDNNKIGVEQIPEYVTKKIGENINKILVKQKLDNKEYKFILKEIFNLNSKNELVGREKIAIKSQQIGLNMTISQVRTKLDKLEKMGYIVKNKGKFGTKLTEKGREILIDNL